jgi:hypothetical protein
MMLDGKSDETLGEKGLAERPESAIPTVGCRAVRHLEKGDRQRSQKLLIPTIDLSMNVGGAG